MTNEIVKNLAKQYFYVYNDNEKEYIVIPKLDGFDRLEKYTKQIVIECSKTILDEYLSKNDSEELKKFVADALIKIKDKFDYE